MGLKVHMKKSPVGVEFVDSYVNIQGAAWDGLTKSLKYWIGAYSNQEARNAGDINPVFTQMFEIPFDGTEPMLPAIYQHLKTVNYSEPQLKIEMDFSKGEDVLEDEVKIDVVESINPDDQRGQGID